MIYHHCNRLSLDYEKINLSLTEKYVYGTALHAETVRGKIDALAISIVHILEQALKPQPLLRFQRFESIFP